VHCISTHYLKMQRIGSGEGIAVLCLDPPPSHPSLPLPYSDLAKCHKIRQYVTKMIIMFIH
jgi:hypothetical protein